MAKKSVPNRNQKKKKNTNWTAITIASVTIVVIIAIAILGKLTGTSNSTNDTLQDIDTSTVYSFNLDGVPYTGQEDAPITLIEFGDYQCPHCITWKENIYPTIEQKLIDEGIAKLYYMNFPVISPESVTIMEAARSVYHQDSNEFWNVHHALFAEKTTSKLRDTDYLLKLIDDSTNNINIDQVKSDLENGTYKDEIQSDIAQGSNNFVDSTPALFVNGKRIANSFDIVEIQDAVNSALEEGNVKN